MTFPSVNEQMDAIRRGAVLQLGQRRPFPHRQGHQAGALGLPRLGIVAAEGAPDDGSRFPVHQARAQDAWNDDDRCAAGGGTERAVERIRQFVDNDMRFLASFV